MNLSPIINFLEKEKKVKFAYLFGSQASSRTGPLSDMDIAVYLDRTVKPGIYRLRLMEALSKVIGRNDLDLIVLNEASPLLKHEVIKYGRILKDASPLRTSFEIETIQEFLDTAHLRQVQRTVLADSIMRGNAFGT